MREVVFFTSEKETTQVMRSSQTTRGCNSLKLTCNHRKFVTAQRLEHECHRFSL